MNLKAEDLDILANIIKQVPLMQTAEGRQNLLIYSNLEKFAHDIHFERGASEVSMTIIRVLNNYGRMSYEQEALGRFLSYIKDYVGIEQQEQIDKIIIEYNMMVPIIPTQKITKEEWKGSESPEDLNEAIISDATLRPISFLEEGLKMAKSVASLDIYNEGKQRSGTGFLISSDLLLTNNHIIESKDFLEKATIVVKFNFQNNFDGTACTLDEYQIDSQGFFHTNPTLDYTIVQLKEKDGQKPSMKWGYIPIMKTATITPKKRVNIIQHPGGRPKQISMQSNFVAYSDQNIVQYLAATLKGSSGSPVFNDEWKLVALHHRGGNMQEPNSNTVYFRNQGITINKIWGDLPNEITEYIKEELRN